MNESVKQIFERYPEHVKPSMLNLRDLILETASKLKSDTEIEETLKWGEPSYLIQGGTTIRIDWKESNPECIGIYFNCQTKLIDTFRTVYGNELSFEGNRAILIDINSDLPQEVIEDCVNVAFTYHQRKKLPLLEI